MSIALIVTRGFGNGTLAGTIKDVVTRGYTSKVSELEVDLPVVVTMTAALSTEITAEVDLPVVVTMTAALSVTSELEVRSESVV